jgi:hypothetical protein
MQCDETVKEEDNFEGYVYAVLPPPDAYQVMNTRDYVQKDTILTNSSKYSYIHHLHQTFLSSMLSLSPKLHSIYISSLMHSLDKFSMPHSLTPPPVTSSIIYLEISPIHPSSSILPIHGVA